MWWSVYLAVLYFSCSCSGFDSFQLLIQGVLFTFTNIGYLMSWGVLFFFFYDKEHCINGICWNNRRNNIFFSSRETYSHLPNTIMVWQDGRMNGKHLPNASELTAQEVIFLTPTLQVAGIDIRHLSRINITFGKTSWILS